VGFECYRIGDLKLNAGTQEVTRDGEVIPVPRLSFRLLLSLARHAPNVVSAQQLEEEVWQGLVVDRGTVNKRVLLLRKALGEDEGADPYIAVIRGSGYRLIAEVERLDCPTGEQAGNGDGRQSRHGQMFDPRRSVSFWLLVIVALLSLYHGYQMTIARNGTTGLSSDAVTQSQLSPTSYSRTSVAVLPFVDMSENQGQQFLGDGIAEELINLLTAIDGLNVAARTSSFAFRDSDLTTLEIAPRLKVGTILEGSIRQSSDRIRVTAQLIDAQTGYHIWSQNYDRALGEIFAVQDDIASNIARTLSLTLNDNNRVNSRRVTTRDIEAFELYLKGRELFNNRISLRAKGLHDALEHFSEAVEKDPGFAQAHAGIALVSRLLTSYDDALDKEAYLVRAETSANFALELDPLSTDALSTLALVYEDRGDIVKAAAYYEQIRDIGGHDSNISHWDAMLQIRLGYFDKLIEPLTEVYRLEPFNEHIGWSLATALNFSGNPLEAMSILERLKNFSYRRYVMGLCAVNAGDFSLARELLRDVSMRSGKLPAVYADMLIDALEDPGRMDEIARIVVAAVEAGELAELVGFESLLIIGSPRVFELGIDPLSDFVRLQIHTQVWNNWAVEVRRDPRFKEWVRTLGNVDFWYRYGWPDRCRPTGNDDFECI
jgi:TolB-like protein/DNA-binding winged helix-turn-helix (wHTH) protein